MREDFIMLVFELPMQIYFLAPVPAEQVSGRIARLLDGALEKNGPGGAQKSLFWPYTFDQPCPLEAEHIYLEGKIYTVRIRTVSQELAEFFIRRLPGAGNDCIHVLSGQLRLIPRCLLERVHSLTPVVVKTERGYWRNQMQLVEYEERLKENLIRKYNFFQHASLSGDFLLFRDIAFMNRKPVRVAQSDIALLGDKVCLTAAGNDTAQELLYMALGTGMGENNARGCGFLGYRFR